jgi:hypothetical protein
MDTATEFLFGKSINSLRPDATAESKQFSWAFDYALGCIAQKMRFGKFHWLYHGRRYTEACKYIHDHVRPIIRHAVEYRQAKKYVDNDALMMKNYRKGARAVNPEKTALSYSPSLEESKDGNLNGIAKENDQEERYVFLYELAKQTASEQELRDQVINTLIAGRDTTASLMSSTLFILSRRPDIWAKLRAEFAFLSGNPPTFEQIKELKYLRFVLNETLRLFPVVPIEAKFANKDTLLPRGGGVDGQNPVFVQKGQMIVWILYSMHRRTDLWGSDAAEFKPERWEGLLPGFNFLPFNGGPRICPGKSVFFTAVLRIAPCVLIASIST